MSGHAIANRQRHGNFTIISVDCHCHLPGSGKSRVKCAWNAGYKEGFRGIHKFHMDAVCCIRVKWMNSWVRSWHIEAQTSRVVNSPFKTVTCFVTPVT